MATIPQCNWRAIFLPWRLDQIDEPSPYLEAFESAIASAIDFTRLIAIVGPKVSSNIAVEFSGTSSKITGSTNGALTESEPPSATLAPLAIASSICP